MAGSVFNKALDGLDPLKKRPLAPAKPVVKPAAVAPRPLAPVAPAAPRTPPPMPQPVQEKAIAKLSPTVRAPGVTPPTSTGRVSVQAPTYTPRDAIGTTQASVKPQPAVQPKDPMGSAIDRLDDGGGVSMAPSPYEKAAQAKAPPKQGTGNEPQMQIQSQHVQDPRLADRQERARREGNGLPGLQADEIGAGIGATGTTAGGATPNPQADIGDPFVSDEERRQRAREDAKRRRDASGIDGTADGVPDDATQTMGDALGEDGVAELSHDDDDLSALAAEMAKEQAALDMELQAENAQNLMRTQATTGLGGFGLSGASAALGADVANKGVRNRVLTNAELGRGYRGEGREDRRLDITEKSADAALKRADSDSEWQNFVRDRALDDLEETDLRDINHDGRIGNMTPEEVTEARDDEGQAEENEAAAVIAARYGGTGTPDDPIGAGQGGVDERGLRELVDAGVGFNDIEVEQDGAGGPFIIRARGSDGNFYVFQSPRELPPNASAQDVEHWFRGVA